MHKGMIFNHVRDESVILLEGRKKAPFHPLIREFRSTTTEHRLKKSKRGILLIFQPIGYLVDSDEDALERADKLAAWLITKEVAPLQFDDEPGRTYWCVVRDSIDDLNRFAHIRRGTITFMCTHTTGEHKQLSLTPTAQLLEVTGQTSTPWSLEVDFTTSASRFEMWAGETYLQLNHTFVAGDKLIVNYLKREVFLNGQDFRKIVSMSSHFKELEAGYHDNFRATHNATLKYEERFY